MSPARHLLPVLLCAAYLPAAALPCPTTGLDRERTAAAADSHAHGSTGHTAAAGHEHRHDDAHAPAPTATPAESVQAPCPCGCGGRAKLASGGRLGPALISLADSDDAWVVRGPVASPIVGRRSEPTRDLEPIPI